MDEDIDIEELWKRRMTRFYRVWSLGMLTEESARNIAEFPTMILWWAVFGCLSLPLAWWIIDLVAPWPR